MIFGFIDFEKKVKAANDHGKKFQHKPETSTFAYGKGSCLGFNPVRPGLFSRSPGAAGGRGGGGSELQTPKTKVNINRLK